MKKWQILCNLILEILVFLLCSILGIVCIPKLLGFFWPFVASAILAMFAGPLCSLLEKKIKLNKKWSSALILIIVLLALAAIGYSAVMMLGKQLISLLSESPKYYNYWVKEAGDFVSFLSGKITVISPGIGKHLQESLNGILEQAGGLINNMAPQWLDSMGSIASNVTNGLVGFVVMILSAYFFIADKDRIIADLAKFLPDSIRKTIREIRNHIVDAMGGFLRAQFKIMGIIFLILLVGLLILRSPYALLFALLIALLDLLPIFGTGTVLIPWAIVELLNRDFKQTIILVVLYVICLFTRQLLQPKIIGEDMGLGTLQTLVLIYVGYKIAGVKGMILALFVGIVFMTLYKLGLFDQKIKRVSRLITQYMEYDEE